jgi:uncharacterized protein (TIGR00266 family)
MFGRRVDIGEIATAAARDANFLADALVAFENQNGTSAFSGLDGAHETCCAPADDDNVISHEEIIYDDAGRVRSMPAMYEVDYKIFGSDMQFVEVELDPGEAAVAEAGALFYMEDGITMETIFGDGSRPQTTIVDVLLGAGKRLLTGAGLFMTVFSNSGSGKKHVSFAAPTPGKIVPIRLADVGGELITQKDSFLVAAKGVSIGIAFQKRLGVGFFGGEGFIMERLQGDGWAFVHAGGMLIERTLGPGELLRVDTGCLVALQPSVDYDIEYIGNIKSAIFGGEGLFFATLKGPGHVWLQSLPLSRLARRIVAAAPQTGRGGREEGSVLGTLSDILSGDR